MSRPQYHGVEAHEELDVVSRRDDSRSTRQRFADMIASPAGTIRLFCLLTVVCLVLSPVPFFPEVVVFVTVLIYGIGYNYRGKTWSMPFRVPRYLAEQGYKDKSTGASGDGLIYLGAERSSNSDEMTEVWATSNDIRTHRLVAGTTGSGKSEEMMGSIFNALMLNSGMLMVDGKASQQSYDSIYRLCRLFGREEELFVVNYIMGGKDLFGPSATKLSNTFNPFTIGGSAMAAELMNSLMPDGKKDVWSDRAQMFNAAITPILSFLSMKGYVLFSPGLLVEYLSLDRIENFMWFGIIERFDGVIVDLKTEDPVTFLESQQDQVSSAMRTYLEQLPGYAMCKPTKPHDLLASEEKERQRVLLAGFDAIKEWAGKRGARDAARAAQSEKSKGGNQAAEQSRGKVYEQHGYITMQLAPSISMLKDQYGHIYNVEQGEIDYRDLMLNRRIMYTALPSLERSTGSLAALGKLAVASIKSVLAGLLDTPFEGFRREIIEGRPSNSEVPYMILCDEYGYYVVEGFAVAPAQARSFGVSITFGTQSLDDLKKANPNEGAATWDNTNMRHVGRVTGGEESETFKKFSGAAGSAYVSTALEMTHRRGKVGSSFDISKSSRAEKVSRLNVADLNAQQDGQFTLIVGSKTDASKGPVMARAGGVKVIRYLAFYTGTVPKVQSFRLNHFCEVRPITDERVAALQMAARTRRALQGIRADHIEEWLSEPAQEPLRASMRDSLLAALVEAAAALPADLPVEAAGAELAREAKAFVQSRLNRMIDDKVTDELTPLYDAIADSIHSQPVSEEARTAIENSLKAVFEGLHRVRVRELTVHKGVAQRVAQGRALLAA